MKFDKIYVRHLMLFFTEREKMLQKLQKKSEERIIGESTLFTEVRKAERTREYWFGMLVDSKLLSKSP